MHNYVHKSSSSGLYILKFMFQNLAYMYFLYYILHGGCRPGHEEKHHFQISYGLKSYPVRRINAAVKGTTN